MTPFKQHFSRRFCLSLVDPLPRETPGGTLRHAGFSAAICTNEFPAQNSFLGSFLLLPLNKSSGPRMPSVFEKRAASAARVISAGERQPVAGIVQTPLPFPNVCHSTRGQLILFYTHVTKDSCTIKTHWEGPPSGTTGHSSAESFGCCLPEDKRLSPCGREFVRRFPSPNCDSRVSGRRGHCGELTTRASMTTPHSGDLLKALFGLNCRLAQELSGRGNPGAIFGFLKVVTAKCRPFDHFRRLPMPRKEAAAIFLASLEGGKKRVVKFT